MTDANCRSGEATAVPARPLVNLLGPRIRLRPFRPDEVEAAWQGLAQQDEAAHPRRRAEDRRPQPSEQFRRRLHRSGRLWRGCLDLAIDRDGRLVGVIQARTRPAQTLPAGVYEIGVILYQPRDRGNGYGAEAVELLTTWLFETAKAERVQAGTDVGNGAMRAVLERLGFQLEGILRGYGAMSDGTRSDGAMYAVLKPEWVAPTIAQPDRLDPSITGRARPARGGPRRTAAEARRGGRPRRDGAS
jgi:[ribosomal protein S5]-alanine N-acetyltransferase